MVVVVVVVGVLLPSSLVAFGLIRTGPARSVNVSNAMITIMITPVSKTRVSVV